MKKVDYVHIMLFILFVEEILLFYKCPFIVALVFTLAWFVAAALGVWLFTLNHPDGE